VEKKMKFDIKLVDSVRSIEQKILKALSVDINRSFQKAIPGIKDGIKQLLLDSLKRQPEYGSLLSGTLRFDFGISNPGSVDKVVEFLADTGEISFNRVSFVSGKLTGGMSISFMKSDDMNGLIYTDIASVVDQGTVLPWLEWLLYHGTSPIVKKYQVEYGPNPNSRTGNAIMVESTSDWSVPSSFSGNINDNWTTRAAESISDSAIVNVIQKNIERNI
jgi:hypothetical protein